MEQPNEDFTETCKTTETVYQGRLLHVKQDEVVLPNGHLSSREYIVHPGAVVVIPVLDDGRVILERQHRYPLHRDFIELPAGKLDPGEGPLGCGKRELLEETGYVAAAWSFVATIHPCIGYSNELMHLYYATHLAYEGHRRDHDEFLEVITMTLAEALEWVRDGRITDAKTMIGLMWADRVARGEWTLKPLD